MRERHTPVGRRRDRALQRRRPGRSHPVRCGTSRLPDRHRYPGVKSRRGAERTYVVVFFGRAGDCNSVAERGQHGRQLVCNALPFADAVYGLLHWAGAKLCKPCSARLLLLPDSLCAAQHLDAQSNRTLDSYGIVNGDVLLVWGKQRTPQGGLQEEAASAARRDVPALVLHQILSTATCEEADARMPSYGARGVEHGLTTTSVEAAEEATKEVAVRPVRARLRQASIACVSCVVVTGKIALTVFKTSRRPAAIPPTYQHVTLHALTQ